MSNKRATAPSTRINVTKLFGIDGGAASFGGSINVVVIGSPLRAAVAACASPSSSASWWINASG
jgi:hypothetical protein